MQLETVKVAAHGEFQGGYRLLEMCAPGIAPQVRPGQFVHLRVPHLNDALLRRPFSIFKADGDRLSILYKTIGAGTAAMAGLRPGDPVSLLGPLGNGFPTPTPGRLPVLVAGGYGMAALYLVARRQPGKGLAFFGGRTAADILCVPEFAALGWPVRVTTEDGALGMAGRVTDALDRWLAEEGAAAAPEFFACGPNPMLRAVAARAERIDAKAWLSMDRHMGCGVGACLTCVQKIRTPDGGWEWARVCREGPVFECREVVWEETEEP